ncbi:MAG: hypothetical protein Q9159_006350 [Coniocarpon cinnabarinum]
MSIPSTTKAWTVEGTGSFDQLKYHESMPLSPPGEHEVLVKIEGVSLNYRDLIIPQGKYPFPMKTPVIPCSDGAGTVVAVGKSATRFKPGDKVLTLFNQAHQGGPLDAYATTTGLGGALDGTLRQYASFPETGLTYSPSNLSAIESSTLCCAGATAWNGLYGLPGHIVKAGDWVLTQGTGGVSIFALQYAKAAGARVVATTSSAAKSQILKDLGADVIINYKDTPEWGAEAKKATGGAGFNHIVEVAGPRSMQQSLNAIAIDGVISIIGFVGGMAEKEPGFLECLMHLCTVRGILVASKSQLDELVRATEANKSLKPVVDKTVFKGIEKAREAYEYMWAQKHQGNVTIEL